MEDLQRDSVMKYLIQPKTLETCKDVILHVDCVKYFTVGCAAQYKNKKSFYNQCKHQKDFGIWAE